MMSSGVLSYTVAIPVFNGRDYISRTLSSVREQTIPPTQVILVDDCSTDGTADFVESHFDWVTVIRQNNNKGPASARNKAIELCETPVIMLLDSDDLWLPSKAELQLDFLERCPTASLVFSDFRGVDLNGNPEGWQGGILPQLEGYNLNPTQVTHRGYLLNEDVIGALIKHTSFIHPSVACFRTEAIRSLGAFDTSHVGTEDIELWIRFSSKFRVGYIDKILTVTESRPGSLGKTRIRMNEGLVRLYSSLATEYPEAAGRNQKTIRDFLKLRYAYLSELYFEQNEIGKAWTSGIRSLRNGFSRRGVAALLKVLKTRLISVH